MTHSSMLLAFLALTSPAVAQVAETWSLTIDESALADVDDPRA